MVCKLLMAKVAGNVEDAHYASLLQLCIERRGLQEGRCLHARILSTKVALTSYLSNLLILFYGTCSRLQDAHSLFRATPCRNIFSWNIIIAAEARANPGAQRALRLFDAMLADGIRPDKFTLLAVLSGCRPPLLLTQGKALHPLASDLGADADVLVRNALANMYARCGDLPSARAVFDATINPSLVSWNTVIASYAGASRTDDALALLSTMKSRGVAPDRATFLGLLNPNIVSPRLDYTQAIHEHIRSCRLTTDIAVQTALLTMYGKSHHLHSARCVFDEMAEKNVISWSAMIAAYARAGQFEKALHLARQMVLEGVEPNRVTFLNVLEACASPDYLENGKAFHQDIIVRGLQSNTDVSNALINMYSRCGSLEGVREVFYGMDQRDAVSWTSTIAACSCNGHAREAMDMFSQMHAQGVKANKITFLTILDAAIALASLEKGRMIHAHILANGSNLSVAIKTALLNMYGKCGSLRDAEAIFNAMCGGNAISWTSMIVIYSQNGHSKEALRLFKLLDVERVTHDKLTFVSIFNACSHSGLPDECWHYFTRLSEDYGITPCVEHYMCMIDLLGRLGFLEEAKAMVKNMPAKSDDVVLTTILGAYKFHTLQV